MYVKLQTFTVVEDVFSAAENFVIHYELFAIYLNMVSLLLVLLFW